MLHDFLKSNSNQMIKSIKHSACITLNGNKSFIKGNMFRQSLWNLLSVEVSAKNCVTSIRFTKKTSRLSIKSRMRAS